MENKKTANIYLFSAAGALLLSLILRTVNFFTSFDSITGYYKFGAALPVISNWILAASVVFLLVFSILKFRKKSFDISSGASKIQYIAAALASVASVALAASDLSHAINTSNRFFILSFTLSIMTALYFATVTVELKSVYKVITGLFAAIRITILIITCFSDFSVAVNTPDRVIYALAAASVLIFIASELKLIAGNVRSWLYIFSAGAATVLCSVSAIPSIIAFHAGLLPKENSFCAEYYLMLGIAVYSAVRLINTVYRAKADNTEKTEPEEPAASEE